MHITHWGLISTFALALLATAAQAQEPLNLDVGQATPQQLPTANSLDLDLFNSRPGTSGYFDCRFRDNSVLIHPCLALQYGDKTSDFDRVDDARAFTSEALFAQSALRLNRPLTRDELRSIARARDEFETRDHATLTYGAWPSLDLFVQYRNARHAQITDFFIPTQTNAIDVLEYGIYTEKTFPLDLNPKPTLSTTLGLGYSRANREGLVEFLPKRNENVDQYSARFGLLRNFGSGGLVLNANYDYQTIDTAGLPAFSHNRSIYGARLIYFDQTMIAPAEKIGTQYLIGAAHDVERFGAVDVPKDDYFVGLGLFGMRPFGGQTMPIDFRIIPAVLTSSAGNDSSQRNAQYRTNLEMRLHIVDPGPTGNSTFEAVSLSFPLRHDKAIQGPNYFENYRIGLHLNALTKAIGLGGAGSVRLNLTIAYDFQSFYNIGKSLNQFGIRVSAGF